MRCLLAVLFLTVAFSARADYLPPGVQNVLAPFTTDGCSMIGDGATKEVDGVKTEISWQHCCVEHDIAYWKGGTSEQRETADKKMRQCLRETGMSSEKATAFYLGVRFAQGFLTHSIFRWGNGWKYVRGFEPHTPDELEQINKLQPSLSVALSLELDPGDRPPVELPTMTGDLCMDQVLYQIDKRRNKYTDKPMHVTEITQKMHLGGKYTYDIKIDGCKKTIEVPIKKAFDMKQCEEMKFMLPKAKRLTNVSRLNKQVDSCFK